MFCKVKEGTRCHRLRSKHLEQSLVETLRVGIPGKVMRVKRRMLWRLTVQWKKHPMLSDP